jgi:threonine aldolase
MKGVKEHIEMLTDHLTPGDDTENAVYFYGDGEPQTPRRLLERLATFDRTLGLEPDSYSLGGTIAQLEQQFAATLGKEAAIFLPTGTLANHLAIRTLCGRKPRAVVQEQSHLYNDSGDCVTRLSGITLVPLGKDQPAFALDELQAAVERAVTGRVLNPIGAVMIESPIRRQMGQVVPFEAMQAITDYCRQQQIATHLDGARLYMMSAASGVAPAAYAALFDTVYVSLYKYFGAPFGAILAGPTACLDGLYHERRMFGGSLTSAYFAAALALQGMHGFADHFAAAMARAETLFTRLNALDGLQVGRLAHGSNIFPLTLAADIDAERFLTTMRAHAILIMSRAGDARQLRLTVNTTILRQPLETLVTAFAGASQNATPHRRRRAPKRAVSA